MSGRVLRFEGSIHAEADRLLPWLANGTLEDDERAWVEQHLGECTACQRELAWLQSLQSACSTDQATAGSTRAWRRLRQRLASGGGHKTRRRQRPWLYWVIAAQAAVMLALGIALLRAGQPPPATYHTLSAAPVAQERLVVVFDPQLTEARMRRLLQACDARVIDGPTAAGAWILSVPSARAPTIREALRAAPGVTLVEGLGPEH